MTRTPPRSASSARNVGIAASQNSPLSKLIADTNSMIEKEIEATKKEEEKLGREVPSRPKSGKVLHSQRSASEIEKETARDIAQIRLASPKATVERVLSPQNESNYVPKNRIFMKMPEKVSQAKVQEESHKEIMEPVQLKIPLTSNRGTKIAI